MNQLKHFDFKGNDVRTVLIDGQAWWVLNEVVEVLGLSNSRMVKDRLNDDVSSTYPIPDKLGRVQDTTIINEDGLYDVILESRKPEARAFRKWITSDVLPQIRQTGSYNVSVPSYMIDNPVQRAEKWIEEHKEKQMLLVSNEKKDQIIGELKPKADYTDSILQNKGLVNMVQIAKDYGMSAQEMNKHLHDLKVQYKSAGQWLLYRNYQDKGYTHSSTIDILRSDGRPDIKMNTKWTQKGRLFIYNLLKSQGIIPVIEREENPTG